MISPPVSLRLDDAAQQGKPFAAIGLATKRDFSHTAPTTVNDHRQHRDRIEGQPTRLTHFPPRCRSRQQQRDRDGDRRDEDQRLSVRHAPHRAPPLCTDPHENKAGNA
jgi:hypothetical protein